MTLDRALDGLLKLAIAVAVIASGAFAVVVIVNQMTLEREAGERRALMARSAALDAQAIAPGSALACLDAGAGEAVEAACEKQVFADAQTAARAVAYTAARLALLTEASARQPALLTEFAPARRAIELDRYGLAAHVLATRQGCTAEQCAAFVLLRDTAAVKANLKAQSYDQYVSRYAAAWSKEPDKQVPVAALPAPPNMSPEAPSGHPVSDKYDFPSAASIPPVSIMNAEPTLPKTAAPKADSKADTRSEPSAEDDAAVPTPPRRPQTQAATPSVR